MHKEDPHECTNRLKVEKDELICMFMCVDYFGSVTIHWLNVSFGSNKKFTDWFSSSGKE